MLRAIDEDSPAVPSMLTDYILTGDSFNSYAKLCIRKPVVESFGAFLNIFQNLDFSLMLHAPSEIFLLLTLG